MHKPCLSLFWTKLVSGVLLLPHNFQVVCNHLCYVCSGCCCVYFFLLCLHMCINSAVSHQQQVTALVQWLCVQAVRIAHPETVWKTNTDLCQSFSSLSFSPGTGKPQEGSKAAAGPGCAHLMPTESPFMWRKFISKNAKSLFWCLSCTRWPE